MANIDRTDAKILSALQSNARQTNRAVALSAGLAASTSLERIRSLEERRVITGYHAEVNLVALGRPIQAIVALRLRPKTGALVDRAVEKLWELPETTGIFLITGIDDLIVHLSVASTEALRELVLSKISSIDGVVDERTSLVFEYRRKKIVEPLNAL